MEEKKKKIEEKIIPSVRHGQVLHGKIVWAINVSSPGKVVLKLDIWSFNPALKESTK
jgi:hypothetical protein